MTMSPGNPIQWKNHLEIPVGAWLLVPWPSCRVKPASAREDPLLRLWMVSGRDDKEKPALTTLRFVPGDEDQDGANEEERQQTDDQRPLQPGIGVGGFVRGG